MQNADTWTRLNIILDDFFGFVIGRAHSIPDDRQDGVRAASDICDPIPK
jgi:hypothetical protein